MHAEGRTPPVCAGTKTKEKGMPPRRVLTKKRRRAPTHCTFCRQPMDLSVCAIDWERVWRDEHQQTSGASDPCDDCCCGGCGARKDYPGQQHC